MSKRVLCEMIEDEFTGIVYPTPYNGNCFYTTDSAALREFKQEALTEHPELKGKLRVLSVDTMDKKRSEALDAREHNRGYQELKAYKMSTGAWMSLQFKGLVTFGRVEKVR